MALEHQQHLADKSAFVQRQHSGEASELLNGLAQENRLCTCDVVALEVLYSARNARDYARLQASLDELTWLAIDEAVTARALEVQRLLVGKGQHRVPIPDLLIAATAEIGGAAVLHYDHDFDTIAGVTGQATRWVIPSGTGHGGSL